MWLSVLGNGTYLAQTLSRSFGVLCDEAGAAPLGWWYQVLWLGVCGDVGQGWAYLSEWPDPDR